MIQVRAKRTATRQAPKTNEQPAKLPFFEHLNELRRRLFYVAVSVVLWSAGAYAIEHTIVDWLLEPAHGEKFIYTSVGGGINFLLQVCLYVGIVFSLPVIIYQTLRYVQPLIGKHSTRFIMTTSGISAVLALSGMAFGYFLGLPAALAFLLHQFHTTEISALITIQSYMSFVTIYLAGSAMMFQVPLVIYIINRLKPLKVRTLFKYERWVIVISLIVAALINPTPRVYDLAIIAVPMILSYQVGIALVWFGNRGRRSEHVQRLLRQDAAARAERQSRLDTMEYVWQQSDLAMSLAPLPKSAQRPAPAALQQPSHHSIKPRPLGSRPTEHKPIPSATRPHKYANDFINTRRAPRRHTYLG